MIRSAYPFFNKKYLYNIETNTLHDLRNEKVQCNIDTIDEESIDMYSSLDEMSLMLDHPMYKICPHCMK